MRNDSKKIIINVRKIKYIVKNREIEFEEKYCVDEETNEEIYDRDIEIENDIALYDLYKKEENLLTSKDIKRIREKYDLNQKEFSNAIGLGEITIHRLENGFIQNDSTDAIIRLAAIPSNMLEMATKNKNKLNDECLEKLLVKLIELLDEKEHKIAKFNIEDFKGLNFNEDNVKEIAKAIIFKYNEEFSKIGKKYNVEVENITHLKLQKLLYFVQGLCLYIFGKPAFDSPIVAWEYGPVVQEIWNNYNLFGKKPIPTLKSDFIISDGVSKIIDIVIAGYGNIEATKLVDITHNELPWIVTEKDCEISNSVIQEYFCSVYDN